MDRIFVKRIGIEKVRHLSDIEVKAEPSDGVLRHIVFTGKNGSGKTSLLDSIAGNIASSIASRFQSPIWLEDALRTAEQVRNDAEARQAPGSELHDAQKDVDGWQEKIRLAKHGVSLTFNVDEWAVRAAFERNECVFAYFKAHREFEAEVPTQVEKVVFKERYDVGETPRSLFLKYMLDLKVTQALAESGGDHAKARGIALWFDKVQSIVRDIYEDQTLTIDFDVDTYKFSICEDGREPFDFNSASDGFSAVLDIVVGIILKMAGGDYRMLDFDKAGIVLVDEVENHLHLSLQKRILPYLVELFPNVQFIVSTHSPFVLSSVGNAVVFDLESRAFAGNGMAANTYESIVEGFFNVDSLSTQLRSRFGRYKELAGQKGALSEDELIEVAELEKYLDEIPDYLDLGISTEYLRTKLALHAGGAAR